MNSSLVDLLSVGVLVLLIVDGAAAVSVGRGGDAPGGGGGRGSGEGHPLCGRRDRGLREVGLAPPLSPCTRGNENSSGLDKERVDEMTRELGVGRNRTMQRRRLIIYISNEVWARSLNCIQG